MLKKLFLFIISFCSFFSLGAEQSVEAHIFIHGTRLSFLSLVSAIPTAQRSLTNHHLYAKVVQSSRDDERFHDTQVILDKGLVEIESPMIKKCRAQTLEPNFSRKAAIQAINGYDMLIKKNDTIYRYYTFGWDGMLGDNYRKNDSLDLYNTLVALRDTLQKKHPAKVVRFILHGHSHGGNLILYLGYHENIKKKNLSIEQAILYGTPIQAETAPYCLHNMFKCIISIYSEGDNIQVADKISTASHTSKRRLSDLVNTANKPIIDICIAAEGDRKAFGHATFFFIDMYQNGVAQARRKVFNEIKYLPVMTLAPLFIPLITNLYAKHPQQQMTLNLYKQDEQTCLMSAETGDRKFTIQSDNIIPQIEPVRTIIEKTWKPAAAHKNAINLAKLALLDLMKVTPQHFVDLVS